MASTSNPAEMPPSGDSVTENDLSAAAARLALSVHFARGAIENNARRASRAITVRNAASSCFETSISTTAHTAASARVRNSLSNTVLPTPRKPVITIDCSA